MRRLLRDIGDDLWRLVEDARFLLLTWAFGPEEEFDYESTTGP